MQHYAGNGCRPVNAAPVTGTRAEVDQALVADQAENLRGFAEALGWPGAGPASPPGRRSHVRVCLPRPGRARPGRKLGPQFGDIPRAEPVASKHLVIEVVEPSARVREVLIGKARIQ